MRVPGSQINAACLLVAQKAKQLKAADELAKSAPLTQAQGSVVAGFTPAPGDSSTINGHTLLMSRVMRAENPKIEPPVINEFTEATRKSPDAHFLTTEDRAMVAKVFQYAQTQGVDLGYVDQLAGALGQFRKTNNGEQMSMVDLISVPGQTKGYTFTKTDSATIERILGSEAFKTTELDANFIRHATDKKYATIHHTDFNFLEQMVSTFSSVGDKAEPMGSRFNRYSGPKDYRVQPLAVHVANVKKTDLVQLSDPTRKWGVAANFTVPTMEHIFRTISKVFGRNAHPGLFEILAEKNKR